MARGVSTNDATRIGRAKEGDIAQQQVQLIRVKSCGDGRKYFSVAVIVIGIEERDHVTGGDIQAFVHCVVDAPVRFRYESTDAHPEFLNDVLGAVL